MAVSDAALAKTPDIGGVAHAANTFGFVDSTLPIQVTTDDRAPATSQITKGQISLPGGPPSLLWFSRPLIDVAKADQSDVGVGRVGKSPSG